MGDTAQCEKRLPDNSRKMFWSEYTCSPADNASERQAKAEPYFSQDTPSWSPHPPTPRLLRAQAQTFPRLFSAAGPKTQAGRDLGQSQVPAHVL